MNIFDIVGTHINSLVNTVNRAYGDFVLGVRHDYIQPTLRHYIQHDFVITSGQLMEEKEAVWLFVQASLA